MIKAQKLTPEVYYDHSRDFQLIGRLFEIVFNHVKTNSDNIYNTRDVDKLSVGELELLSHTLGFKSKHNYPEKQLRAMCSCFSDILKVKGTTQSLYLALYALLRAEDISEQPTIIPDDINPYNINVYIPSDLKDTNLFKDLLEYILPAGLSYTIVNRSLNEFIAESISTTSDIGLGIAPLSYEVSNIPKYHDNDGKVDEVKEDNNLQEYAIKGGRVDNTIAVPFDTSADSEYNKYSTWETIDNSEAGSSSEESENEEE